MNALCAMNKKKEDTIETIMDSFLTAKWKMEPVLVTVLNMKKKPFSTKLPTLLVIMLIIFGILLVMVVIIFMMVLPMVLIKLKMLLVSETTSNTSIIAILPPLKIMNVVLMKHARNKMHVSLNHIL
jgi:hypothetical protein